MFWYMYTLHNVYQGKHIYIFKHLPFLYGEHI